VSGLDPPAVSSSSSSSSPHERLCRIERIDAASIESISRLCREYVREDVQAMLAEQRRLAAELDRLPAGFERVEESMRDTREEVQRLMAEAAAVADLQPALHRLYSDFNRAAASAQQLRALLPPAASASTPAPQPAG
jgi:phage gp37-like protein